MSRPSALLLSIAAAGVLLALVLLWHLTRTEPVALATPQPAPAAGRGVHADSRPAAPARPASRTTASAPAAKPGYRMPFARTPAAPAREDTAPSMPEEGSNSENLHYGGTQLRAQAAAVEHLVRACAEKTAATGARPSGDALLTYVVAKQGDKYVVEDTSFDGDETTLKHEGLLTCLHQTAKKMTFIGLPRRSEALVVMRKVTLKNGAVTEYKHVGFSYLR